MSQAASARLVDTTEICAEFGTSPARISTWYRDRATTGFPDPHHSEGRKRFWEHSRIDAFFAAQQDARAPRELPASVLKADQGELLTTSEVTSLVGYAQSATIYWYLKNLPGYFPDPDDTIDGMRWRRGTIVNWIRERPGKGRRPGAVRKARPLPEVSAEGDPRELLGSAEAAALLGYSSVPSFSSALFQGNIPELAEHELVAGARGGQVKVWRRETIATAAQRRGLVSAPASQELVDAEGAAAILGYSSAASFNGALNRGRLPELEEPDALEAQPGGRGRPQKKWSVERLQQLAAARTT